MTGVRPFVTMATALALYPVFRASAESTAPFVIVSSAFFSFSWPVWVCLHEVLKSLVALRRRVYTKGALEATFEEEQQRLAVSTNHLEILINDNEVRVWDSTALL
jgi:hypothetical protein